MQALEDRYLKRWRVTKEVDFDWSDRYAIRPTTLSPVIVPNADAAGNHLELMRFGLIPSWSKTAKLEFTTINATAERIDQAPTYKRPFREHRGLMLVSGFYEPKKSVIDGKKESIPHYFKLKEDGPFVLAVVFDVNTIASDAPILSYSIVTTTPNELVGQVHHRMPVILSPEDAALWLDPDADADTLKSLLYPYPSSEMEGWQVSKLVNFYRNEGPELIKPVAPLG